TQYLLVGHLVEIGEERDFDRGETLQVNARPDALEAAQHLQVVVKRQIRMQAVDDVNFGQRLMRAITKFVPRLLERHRVRPGISGPETRERTEEAARYTDVGRLETDVEVVVRPSGVPFLPFSICEPAE